MTRSRRIKRDRVDPATRLARDIGMPSAQIIQGDFTVRDVANHTEADQRHSVRSGTTRTIYKLSRLQKLCRRLVIGEREAKACEAYANAHAMRYDTNGVTARYGEGGGCRQTNFDHLPKTPQQEAALRYFDDCRAAIRPNLLPMFERVVLYGQPIGRWSQPFQIAARQLLNHIETTIGLDVT